MVNRYFQLSLEITDLFPKNFVAKAMRLNEIAPDKAVSLTALKFFHKNMMSLENPQQVVLRYPVAQAATSATGSRKSIALTPRVFTRSS